MTPNTAFKGTILITGANGGLGHQIVSRIVSSPELAGHYYGLYAVRDARNAPALQSALSGVGERDSYFYSIESLDLSRLASVRSFAASVNTRVAAGELQPIRALILNAGYSDMGQEQLTEDGFDMSFASNYLGHWLLTLLLLQSMDRECGRIVVLGSITHDVNHPMNKTTGYYNDEAWKTFFKDDDAIDAIARGTWATNATSTPYLAGGRRYGASKMCAVMMIRELQRRLDTDSVLRQVSVVGVDPGTMYTGLIRNSPQFVKLLMFPLIIWPLSYLLAWFYRNPAIRTPARSARDVLRAAMEVDPKLRGAYLNGTELSSIAREAADAEKSENVWEHSVQYTHLTSQDTILRSWA